MKKPYHSIRNPIEKGKKDLNRHLQNSISKSLFLHPSQLSLSLIHAHVYLCITHQRKKGQVKCYCTVHCTPTKIAKILKDVFFFFLPEKIHNLRVTSCVLFKSLLRTVVAREIVYLTALRNCSKDIREEPGYIGILFLSFFFFFS